VIREVADRVLRGESLTAIAADLVERGVPTARGGRWTSQHVRVMLGRASLAGLRSHRGEIVGRAVWPAILDEAKWRRVRAALGAPVVTDTNGRQRRITRVRPRQPRRYLLTGGIAVCGRVGCGAPLVAQTRTERTRERSPIYCCHPNKGGCSRVSIGADALEAYVAGEVIAALSSPQMAERLRQGDQEPRGRLRDEIANLEARWGELARQQARGDLPPAVWTDALSELQAEHRRLHAALDAIPSSGVLDDLDPASLVDAWESSLTLAQKRQVVSLLVESVTVLPAQPGTRKFDPERVQIRWKV
jgi:site-specific DNA recombinase